MSDTVAILGQSNAANLWVLSGISTFSSTLNALTNKTVSIIQGAVGGAALLKCAASSSTPHNYWLDKDDSASPLHAFLANDLSMLKAIWWVHGEQEASYGVSVEAYLGALIELQAIIAGAAGRQQRDLPFVVSPLGNTARTQTNGWKVRTAHEIALTYPGFVRGPEYIDLAVESDNTHLTSAARETFATRAATILAPILGIAPASSGGGSASYKVGSLSIDLSAASADYVVSLPFAPKSVTFLAGKDGSQCASVGLDDGATCGLAGNQMIVSNVTVKTGFSIQYIDNSGVTNYVQGKITAMGSSSFTLHITKTGSPTGTLAVIYEAKG